MTLQVFTFCNSDFPIFTNITAKSAPNLPNFHFPHFVTYRKCSLLELRTWESVHFLLCETQKLFTFQAAKSGKCSRFCVLQPIKWVHFPGCITRKVFTFWVSYPLNEHFFANNSEIMAKFEKKIGG